MMEDCGKAIQAEYLSEAEWKKAKTIVEKIHGCGVVHGDLKSDDFVVSKDGDVRLVDMGLATKPETGQVGSEGGMDMNDRFLEEVKVLERLRER